MLESSKHPRQEIPSLEKSQSAYSVDSSPFCFLLLLLHSLSLNMSCLFGRETLSPEALQKLTNVICPLWRASDPYSHFAQWFQRGLYRYIKETDETFKGGVPNPDLLQVLKVRIVSSSCPPSLVLCHPSL